jgi:Reverse transcriptase (RNA-dependent DNA polymerase)
VVLETTEQYNPVILLTMEEEKNDTPEEMSEPSGELISQDMIDIAMLNNVEFYGKVKNQSSEVNYDDVDPIKYKDMFKVSATFDESWNHLCLWQRAKWRGGIGKENTKMRENKVMKVIDRNQMEKGRACIKYTWVFEIKRDGTFRARLVACGYSQKPGVDFQELCSPVFNDVVFRILIVLQMIGD